MPSTPSSRPVSAALSASTTSVAVSSWSCWPWAIICAASVATSAAVTAEVEPSGPPMPNGSELRSAISVPPIAPVMKVAAMP